MYRVLVTGPRDWGSYSAVLREIKLLKKRHGTNLIVIGGGAPGLDTIAKVVCQAENIHFAEVKALWNTRHRSAGPQRNTAMLWLEPHEVIAFHRDLSKSRGTKDMVTQAENAQIPVKKVRR